MKFVPTARVMLQHTHARSSTLPFPNRISQELQQQQHHMVRCVRVCKSCKPCTSNILNIVQISVQCESISGSSGGGSSRRRSLVHRVASVCGDAALIVRVSATMSQVTRHTTHVTCHTSHVTRHTSNVKRHLLIAIKPYMPQYGPQLFLTMYLPPAIKRETRCDNERKMEF